MQDVDQARDGPDRPEPRLAPWAAAALTFLAAGSVLVLEIAAARLLAPYVGVTITTYTAIIGVILAGISLGAWLGGLAADRFGPRRLIGPTLAAGGLAAIASVPVVALAGDRGGDGPAAAVTLAALGFVAPAATLSAVAPMVVRASIVDLRTSGSLVGRLSAIGTAGAIAGTFLTGFALLGLFPTRAIIAGTGGVLVLVGVAAAIGLRRPPGAPVPPVLAIAAAGSLLFGVATAAAPSPCERESAYYCIAVVSDREHPSGRTLVLDRLWHAYVDLADPTELRFLYFRWFAAASEPVLDANGGRIDALHVGGGGFTFPRYLAAVRPDSRHVVLELDPAVLDTARRRELGLSTDGGIDVRLGDARRTIAPLPDDGFDLVVGDAFGGLSVPWHLTTAEFVAEIDRVLRPGGRYLMNIIDTDRLALARAAVATLRARFEHVAVIAAGGSLEGGPGGNVVLVASHAPLGLDAIRSGVAAYDGGPAVVEGDPARLASFAAGSPVLTDDFAPVDQLIGR